MFGLLNVHKPPGPTSHDVVARVRRLIGGPRRGRRRVKVGHAGTLDPFAEGVLVVCVGPATRLADYVQSRRKRYRATIVLGATSTTDDVEGDISERPDAPRPAPDDVQGAVAAFRGEIEQIPPAHSAVHVNGRRAYQLARAGEVLDLPSRTVTIHEIDVVEFEFPRLVLDVACSSGTYVRSIARDVGEALGCGGYCAALQRTAVGEFDVSDAVPPAELDLARDLLPAIRAVGHLPVVALGTEGIRNVSSGRPIRAPGGLDAGEVALTDRDGHLLAIASVDFTADCIRPSRVFVRAD